MLSKLQIYGAIIFVVASIIGGQAYFIKEQRAKIIAKETELAIKDANLKAKNDAEKAVTVFVEKLQKQNQEMQALLEEINEVEGGSEILDPYLQSVASKLWP